MPVLSKTVEVNADAASIMAIVADFEAYPQWSEGIKGAWVLARYDDGRPSQLRLDTEVNGMPGTYIQAVYYPDGRQPDLSCRRLVLSDLVHFRRYLD